MEQGIFWSQIKQAEQGIFQQRTGKWAKGERRKGAKAPPAVKHLRTYSKLTERTQRQEFWEFWDICWQF
jgi:hypothetical protein